MDELKLAMLASQMAKHAREKKAAQKKIKALTDKGDAIGAANIHLVAAVADFNKEQAARWIENSVRSDGKYLQKLDLCTVAHAGRTHFQCVPSVF